jgi:hypothetical protein
MHAAAPKGAQRASPTLADLVVIAGIGALVPRRARVRAPSAAA